jgi:hypothetical protein
MGGNFGPSTSEPIRRSSKHYTIIREHAIMMAEALQSKLLGQECHCKLVHNANLILEVRTGRRFWNHCFRVLFGFDGGSTAPMQPPWISREMEIQALELSEAPNEPGVLKGTKSDQATAPTIIVEAVPDSKEVIEAPERNPAEKKRSHFKRLWRSRSPRSSKIVPEGDPGNDKAIIAQTDPQTVSKSENAPKVAFDIPETRTTDEGAKEIDNLCSVISKSSDESLWGGILISRGNRWQKISKAKLACFSSEKVKAVSLAELLSSDLWTIDKRSKLGLQLASTVLQLYQTPWLRDDWGKEDIFFVQEANETLLIDKPFLRPRFSQLASSTKCVAGEGETIFTNVPCLFALGVVIIELHYGKSIDQLQKEDPGLTASSNEV